MPKLDLSGQRFGRLIVDFASMRPDSQGCFTYWICVCDCGNVKRVSRMALKQGMTKSCGCLKKDLGQQRTGPLAHNWKGGRRINAGGYITVRHNGRHVGEHRLVMEAHLGRELLPGETVHHANGMRDDNRIENLELWSKSQPAGQRVVDKILWAIEFLESYDYKVTK